MQSKPPTIRIRIDNVGHLWVHHYTEGLGYNWHQMIATGRTVSEDQLTESTELIFTLPS